MAFWLLRRLQASRLALGVPVGADQAGAFEHLEMLRDRRLAEVEGLADLVDGGGARGQAGQDGAAGWIRERGERGVQVYRLDSHVVI